MLHVKKSKEKRLRIHMTNVSGIGAVQLVQSLVPAIERHPGVCITHVYAPCDGKLAAYSPLAEDTLVVRYPRFLPNGVSRVLECTMLANQFSGDSPILVLGDMPLQCSAHQTVFVQTSHLIPARWLGPTAKDNWKYKIAQALFKRNLSHVDALIVQTPVVRNMLEQAYPNTVGKVSVISQPVPEWLLREKVKRRGRVRPDREGLRLFYPAAAYPHKNHQLLSRLFSAEAERWPVSECVLTIDQKCNPAPNVPWISCVGLLDPSGMVQYYADMDGVIFLSRAESYGFPLVEAMFVGLPIVCPDLSYARTLCGSEAIYFDCDSLESLRLAVNRLHSQIRRGWWPDWSKQLAQFPGDWDEVADMFVNASLG